MKASTRSGAAALIRSATPSPYATGITSWLLSHSWLLGLARPMTVAPVRRASWTLCEQVLFDRDRITSAGWDSYPILRFTEVPEVTVRIVDAPGEAEFGAGEIAQGPVAGAIGNAVADAVGVRVRDLPLTPEQIARAIEES